MNLVKLLRPCPICDETQGTKLHRQVFALEASHPLAGGYDVVACERCGFAFADTAATQADYDRYYATLSKYSDSATSTGAGLSPLDAARLQDLAAAIAAYSGDRSQRIVDIGCANGGLLAELRKLGFEELRGVDPAPSCARETERLAGVPAFAGTLFDLPEALGEYDGVILSHVMEHVRDLRLALESVSRRLRPGGWIYIEVPDATRYRECLFAPFQDFNTEHINHFSPESLANLFRQCGFEPETGGRKTLFSAVDMPYPAAFLFARRSASPGALVRDDGLVPALQDYIAGSKALMQKIDERIREVSADGPLIVWGVGQLTLKLLAETALGEARIAAFLDSSPVHQGHLFHGAPVMAPTALRDETTPILVASIINQGSIIETIQRLGLKNPIRTLLPQPAPSHIAP